MTEDYLIESFDRSRYWYLILRILMLVITFLWTVWAALAHADVIGVPLAAAATLIHAVTTVVAIFVTKIPSLRSGRTLLWFAVPDLVYVTLLGLAFAGYDDPTYSLLFALATLYALFVRHPAAWTVGLGATFVFLAIQATIAQPGAMAISIIVLKAAQLFAISFVLHKTSLGLGQRQQDALLSHRKEAELNRQLQSRVSELRAISKIGDILHSQLDFDRTGLVAVEILSKIINVPACCLFVIDKSESKTVFSASVGLTDTVSVPAMDATLMDSWDTLDDHFSCLPLVEFSSLMVVFCADAERIEAMTDEDRIVLETVASQLAVAVENSQLYKLTRRMAITDDLTGLYNYRYLQQRLDDELKRATRYEKDLSLLMIDVDDFKGFNDTRGHVEGDSALRELGEVISHSVRTVDAVCRYGGEEFSVILPETDVSGALVTAAKIREAVSQHLFGSLSERGGANLTVSIGLATFPTHAKDKESLLTIADDALYRAKSTGKNRVRSPLSGQSEAEISGAPVNADS